MSDEVGGMSKADLAELILAASRLAVAEHFFEIAKRGAKRGGSIESARSSWGSQLLAEARKNWEDVVR